MSVSAQVEGVGTLEFPDGTDPSVVQATVKKMIASKGAPKAPAIPSSPTLLEHADIAASAGSGAIASMAGGLVKATGYAREGVEKFVTGKDPGDANAAAAKLEELLTYTPKTDRGKAVMADVQKGLQAFEDWTDKQGDQAHQAIRAAGDKAGEVAKSMGAPQKVVDFIEQHKEQVAAAYGSATKTGLNAVPLVLSGELTKLPGKGGELARPAEAPASAPPSGVPAAPAADLALSASPPRAAPAAVPAAPAAPLEVTPGVPRATPNTSLEGASPPPGPTPSPRARAEAYVRDRLGLSWDALADAQKAKIERVANDARALDRLNPEAVKRQLHLEREGFGRAPIATTAGKLNRDAPQLLREQGAAATPSGAPIRQIDIEANRTLRGNVETLLDRIKGMGQTRATAASREQVGAAVAGKEAGAPGALTVKQAKAKAATRAAYERARNTDPDATVAPDAMYDFVRGSPEVLNPQIQHLSWLNGWLKKAGIEKVDAEGAPTGERRPIKLTELDDLRKKAGKMAGSTGDSAHYAKEVMAAIDSTFEQLPDSAKAWKAAREAHKAERGEFANQGAIARLVETKGGNFGTDPKTALEDIWKVSVKNGKLEDIRTLKRSLLSGDAETRVAGKKALRELKAETVNDMLRDITKGVSTNEAGEANITAESINRWINGMGGREKLDVILGRRATNELMRIREDAQITKTEPTVRNVGSNTFQKVLNWIHDSALGEIASKIPGGGIVKGAVIGAKRLSDNARAVKEAGQSATSVAERSAAKAADKRAQAIQRSQTYGAQ
jgi:hypothetical protein